MEHATVIPFRARLDFIQAGVLTADRLASGERSSNENPYNYTKHYSAILLPEAERLMLMFIETGYSAYEELSFDLERVTELLEEDIGWVSFTGPTISASKLSEPLQKKSTEHINVFALIGMYCHKHNN